MEKLGRKIFQPTTLTDKLINGYCTEVRGTVGDIANLSIISRFTPYTPELKRETNELFRKWEANEPISPEELQAALSRCVRALKDHPVKVCDSLEQVLIHFTTGLGRALRYDYIKIVDEYQDQILHRLNEAIKSVDPDYNMGTREFGERSREVFKHWDRFCGYSDIYVALATIIDCEKIYNSLSVYRTICLIKMLDDDIIINSTAKIGTTYPSNVDIKDKYYGLRYEVLVYQADNGYCALTGDGGFDHIPEEYYKYSSLLAHSNLKDRNITEDDYDELRDIEIQGRTLLKKLAQNSQYNDEEY